MPIRDELKNFPFWLGRCKPESTIASLTLPVLHLITLFEDTKIKLQSSFDMELRIVVNKGKMPINQEFKFGKLAVALKIGSNSLPDYRLYEILRWKM